MNEHRQQRLLENHTALAKKVFEYVPIQEAWTAAEINSALRSYSTTSASHIAVRACIGDMKDQGLIREVRSGYFQRTPVSKKLELNLKRPSTEDTTVQNEKEKTPKAEGRLGTLDQLSALSDDVTAIGKEVVSFATRITERMKELSGRIETVALQVESEREVNEEAANKLRTLQSIFLSVTEPPKQ